MHDESLFAERCLRAGAMGYINKQESPEKIIEAIRRVLSGDIYLSSRMTSRLLQRVTTGTAQGTDPIATLTDRELEVFELIGQGLATKQIAVRLDVCQKTVESHREKIKVKLGLSGASELVRHATHWVLENG